MAETLKFILEGKADQANRAFKDTLKNLVSVKALAIATAAGVAALGGAMLAMAKSTATALDPIGKFSTQIGISTEALSEYHHVAELSGTSSESLNNSFRFMQRNIAEASTGIGTATDALDQLGLSAKDLLKLEPDQKFEAIAHAMQGVGSDAEKVSIAMDIFGRSGGEMLQVINQGVPAIREMRQEARELGLSFSRDATDKAAEFNDTMTRLQGAVKGTSREIGTAILPELTKLGKQLTDFILNNKDAIIGFFEGIVDAGVVWIDGVKILAQQFVDIWQSAKNTFAIIWDGVKIAFNSVLAGLLIALDSFFVGIETVMDKLNIGGILDEQLEKVKGFRDGLNSTLDDITKRTEETKEDLKFRIEFGQSKSDKALADLEAALDKKREIAVEKQLEEDAALATVRAERTEIDKQVQLEIDEWKAQQAEANRQRLADINARADAAAEEQVRQTEQKKLAYRQWFQQNMLLLASQFGKKTFEIAKKVSIAQALISTYESAAEALAFPPGPPVSLIYVALALAKGFLQVKSIQAQQYPAAHGGLTNVPAEQTYLLDKGERVLSPSQNKDLTSFLNATEATGAEGGTTFNISVLENATNVQAMLDMSKADWKDIYINKILPASQEAKREGFVMA